MATCPVKRPELEPLPWRMQQLPVDERGYAIPWFVDYIDGKPEFRAMDGKKYVRAIKEKLCWVCGGQLERMFAFVAGPMCGINRTSAEPPCHIECARWSAKNCPFLSQPNMVRRFDDLISEDEFRAGAPGCAIARNPGVTLVWITREREIYNDGKGKPLIMMGKPSMVEFYREGRRATRAEVLDSIDSGIMALEAAARSEPGGMKALRRMQAQFEKLLPSK